jgi:hypothetical protein
MDAASLHRTQFAGAPAVLVSERIGGLCTFNLAAGVLHAVQGAAILVLSTSFSLPIVTHSLTGPPGSPRKRSHSSTCASAGLLLRSCSSQQSRIC